jgi:hypothetical protein
MHTKRRRLSVYDTTTGSKRGSSSGCLRHSWQINWHVLYGNKVPGPGPAVARHAGYELLDTR